MTGADVAEKLTHFFSARGIIMIRPQANLDLEGRKNEIFLPLPLDANLDGPILVGIQGYGPGKKRGADS